MSRALPTTSRGHGIDALSHRSDLRGVSCAGCLCAVIGAGEEFFLERIHPYSTLLDKCHEAILSTLRPDLLGQSHQTVVLHVLDRSIGDLCTVGQRPQNKVAASKVLDTIRAIDTDSTAGEEVDDAFLENVGWHCLGTTLVFLDGFALYRLILFLVVILIGLATPGNNSWNWDCYIPCLWCQHRYHPL